ncbi:MAG: aryl-sulfate sulfotransferase [Saprospiraceae bacterium]|nr:aryl-sulfate sulfotransferase [Saprospiraceae bacterium]
MKKIIFWALCMFVVSLGAAQNTTALLSLDVAHYRPGYNLIYPFNQANVYLIDQCGEVVHTWEDDEPNAVPGVAAYLTPQGNLVKCKTIGSFAADTIRAGGAGEFVEIWSWDNDLLYSFHLNTGKARLHHDIKVMPNGNILMIAWENFTPQQAIENGRKPSLIIEGAIWPDYIIEVNPALDSIVWEWHAWDHLIQDFDATKKNFGAVVSHPELIDVNHVSASGQADWMHTNAIDYNPRLDIIALSVAHFNEVWFIDHSTTKAESKSHTGGNFGQGGDLIYRWGNPRAYRKGTNADQKLFFQHDVHWAENGSPSLLAFNNRYSPDYSTAIEFTPQFDSLNYAFTRNQNGAYLPNEADESFVHPVDPLKMKSSGLSSVQRLDNDNLLIFSGNQGYAFELKPDNTIAWEYIIPFRNGLPIKQGETATNNLSFKMKRYAPGYPAFAQKDLSPKGFLELEPNLLFCKLLDTSDPLSNEDIEVFPVPFDQELHIVVNRRDAVKFQIYNAHGMSVFKGKTYGHISSIDLSDLEAGLFVIHFPETGLSRKLVKLP